MGEVNLKLFERPKNDSCCCDDEKDLESALRAIAAKIPAWLCEWHIVPRVCSPFADEVTPRWPASAQVVLASLASDDT